MKQKIAYLGLTLIVVATFIEVTFYFVYIFKPLERLFNRDLLVSPGIPTSSELFTPPLLGQYLTQADETKTLYSNRSNDFLNNLKTIMTTNSSFVKTSEINYSIAGYVDSIEPSESGYSIALKNKSGQKYTFFLSSSEIQYAKVDLLTIAQGRMSREYKEFNEINNGDYLVVNKSANLLNPSEIDIYLEILRTSK